MASLLEPSAPVTATPSPPRTPTSAPAVTPRPTPTPQPAPQEDKVGFPEEGYKGTFKQLYIFDRPDNRQVRYVCGNDIAASVNPGEPYPYGSIILFESWRAKEDGQGNLVRDANSHLIRDTMTVIFVMRKERGFGETYQALRNGEWEYVGYRPDKSYSTPPQLSASCAACHLAAGKEKDWVFRTDLLFTKGRYGQTPALDPDEVILSSVAFAPRTLTVKAGSAAKWTNSVTDQIAHTVTATDKSFDSGVLRPGASFSHVFNTAGTFDYICSIHPQQMRATIRVTP